MCYIYPLVFNDKEGAKKESAKIATYNALLPLYRKKSRELYLESILWIYRLEKDPHGQVDDEEISFSGGGRLCCG